MPRTFTILRGSGLLLLLVLVVLFCPLARKASAAEKPVLIGGTLSLTGAYAKVADYKLKGYRLWENEVNARGGILGRPVKLIILDDRSEPATAAALYRRLIVNEHVDLIVAPYSSDITEAILPLTADLGYPLIASGASADRIWNQGYTHVFGLFLPASRFAVGFFEMLVRNEVDRIAILSAPTSFGRDIAAGARLWAGRFGLTVVHEEDISRDLQEYTEIILRSKAAGAEVVFLAGDLELAIRTRRALRAARWMPRAFYAPVGPGTREYLDALGQDADGVFSTSQWEAFTRAERGKDPFSAAYLRAYGKEPSYFAATAYASGEILEAAARKAGTLERSALRKALSTMEAMSVIGRYGVDRTGLQVRNTNLVIQLQDGRKEVVWPAEYRTAAPRFR